MIPEIEPVVLEGEIVRLEPAIASHAASLAKACEMRFFDLFTTMLPESATIESLRDFVLRSRALPNTLTFAVVLRSTGEAIGTTSYMDIRAEHDGLEIGMTWYGAAHQGTLVNPECKLLLLGHAFEALECERVQLKTDLRNVRSQRAIEKLGAAKEGVLRKHARMHDGFMRDTVMYSILAGEWPRVRNGLLVRLGRA